MIGQRLSPLNTFKTYIAVKQHFSSKTYDLFEKGIIIKATQDQLDDRADKSFFYKLSENYLSGDLLDYLMSNVLVGRTHPSEMEDIIYREYKSRMLNLSYIFEQDLKFLVNIKAGFKDLFRTYTGGLPLALQALNGSHISLETICIIDNILDNKIIECFDAEITDPLVYKNLRLKIIKYKNFIRFDIKKLEFILKKYINL